MSTFTFRIQRLSVGYMGISQHLPTVMIETSAGLPTKHQRPSHAGKQIPLQQDGCVALSTAHQRKKAHFMSLFCFLIDILGAHITHFPFLKPYEHLSEKKSSTVSIYFLIMFFLVLDLSEEWATDRRRGPK